VSIDPKTLLATIPSGLRDPLLETYREIAGNFIERKWEPSELNGGKFCECVYWIVHGSISGTFVTAPSKPPNMRDDCTTLEKLKSPTGAPIARSLRILIPRILPALYEIRNNRGVGHVGGDVNPNLMDATAVYTMTSWILAEFVRIFHEVSLKVAQEAVDALVERKIPLVWESGASTRVLDTKLKAPDQVLVLLYQNAGWVPEDDLFNSVEYKNIVRFRADVLGRLHTARLLEHDKAGKRAKLSPKGSDHVEKKILATRGAKA
jgi:hypothetical protein